MPDHAKKIFISYRRSDAAAMSIRICQAMAAQFGRKRVYRDLEDTPVGVRFPEFLQKTLLQCKVALVLIGPTWLQARNPDGTRRLDDPSDIVRVEIETALSHGLLVCPLLLEGAGMPAVEDLAPSLREVHWRNALPIHSSEAEFAQDMQRLAADIKEAVEGRGGRLVERFAIAGRTTAIPLAVGVAAGAAVAKSGGIGGFLQQVWSSAIAKVAAAVVAVAVVAAVVVSLVHGSPPHGPKLVFTGFAIPGHVGPANDNGNAITAGPDGNMWWVVDDPPDEIGRITPGGRITLFPLPSDEVGPDAITAGPDGNLWFTLANTDAIGRITPTGSMSFFSIGVYQPQGITSGPDGDLWFTAAAPGSSVIGRILPAGSMTFFTIANTDDLSGIVTGPGGNLWSVDSVGGAVVRMTPTGTAQVFPLANVTNESDTIAVGGDGNLWCTEGHFNAIARITPSGKITVFPAPGTNVDPEGIARGPDGNIWFTETFSTDVYRITPSGDITGFPLNDQKQPVAIAAGPDKSLWIVTVSDIIRVTFT